LLSGVTQEANQARENHHLTCAFACGGYGKMLRTLPHAIKSLVRQLSRLRSKIANPVDERQAITEGEPVSAPGERQSQTRLAPDEVAKLVVGYRSGRTIYQLADHS
jgi:hypothetical protein